MHGYRARLCESSVCVDSQADPCISLVSTRPIYKDERVKKLFGRYSPRAHLRRELQGCLQALQQQEPSSGSRVLHQPLVSAGTERVPAGAQGQGSSIPPLPPAAGDGSRNC